MAMTQFEKALLGELKGIRKALQKMNEINDDKKVKIPAPEELIAQQINQLMQSNQANQPEVKIDGEQVAKSITYNPLSSR